MNQKKKVRRAVEHFKAHGRNALRRHYPGHGTCIPAARMILEACKRIGVPCEVVPVLTVVRNRAARELGLWPPQLDTGDVTVSDFAADPELVRKGKEAGAAIIIVGVRPTLRQMSLTDIDIHVVPVVGRYLIDLTLDTHTTFTAESLGFVPLDVMVLPCPPDGKRLTAEFVEFDGDVSYLRTPPDNRYLDCAYWRYFFRQNGEQAVDDLLRGWTDPKGSR